MARKSGKGSKGKPPEKLPVAERKAAKDVISQSVEASAAKVADLGYAVQRSVVRGSRPGLPAASPPLTAAAPMPAARPQPVSRELPTPVADIVPPAEVAVAASPEPADPQHATVFPVAIIGEPTAPEPTTMTADAAPAETSPVTFDEPLVSEPLVSEPLVSELMMSKPAEADLPEASAIEPPAEAVQHEPAVAAAATEPIIAAVKVAATPVMAEAVPAAACASRSVRDSMEAAADGLAALNRKTIEAFRTNAGMTFDLVRSLMGARSVAEALLIHTEHARHQFEVMSDQAHELQALARRMTTETAAQFSKGFAPTE